MEGLCDLFFILFVFLLLLPVYLPYNLWMQIFERFHQLKGYANAYLYEDDSGWVLVDTGMPRAFDPVGYLATLGYAADALKHIVITHADIDHIGGLARIQQQSGAQVYAGAKSAELIQKGEFPAHNALLDTLTRWFAKTQPYAAKINIVTDGMELPLMGGLKAIATPGHTADHIAFFSPTTGILFAGDAIVSLNKKLAVSSKLLAHNFTQAKQSAVKLANLAPAIFACGHGTPYTHTMDDVMRLRQTPR